MFPQYTASDRIFSMFPQFTAFNRIFSMFPQYTVFEFLLKCHQIKQYYNTNSKELCNFEDRF